MGSNREIQRQVADFFFLVYAKALICLCFYFQGDFTMEGSADSLVMTVHLLATSGQSLLLQQTLDRLLKWICLDVRLFLVSERVTPVKYYEKYHQNSSGFPGMSILLFLHEAFGEERIFQVRDFFQHPPWQCYHMQCANGKLYPCASTSQEFYSLDEHMPVWGVRQVHYGTEILRVTLYCSFENYDDAIRLYEMILQKEATLQKNNFCVFALYATQSIAVQLCLKQLPPGLSVELKESSVLQFKVHEIGQLVPLLPNPCVPISSTRWQTQDYEGNKILLQVQGNSKHSEKNGVLSRRHNNASEEQSLQSSTLASFPTKWINHKQKSRKMRMNCKIKSEHGIISGSASGTPQSNSCSSSQASRPAATSQSDTTSFSTNTGNKLHIASQGRRFQRQEEETNVDTGFAVVHSECSPSPLSRFARDLQDSLPQPPAPKYLLDAAGSRINLLSENRTHLLSFAVQRNKGAGQTASDFHLRISRASYGNGNEEEEEEFFI
nr:protein FAM124B isoform X1 [Pelodiscus sinensis]XP_014433171.1 protein FAM124B isoform X1 [Pelodiscus sinensis]XP_014433172.1 protein FAM124B isoform X1 [Pelodiscus sinensis]|eukprot:XP_014433170.1 protein FAM124B isoform X1 [Pelodiscus sinensis]